MTEKRFTIKPLIFKEEIRNGIFEQYSNESLSNREIVNILNEQSKTITRLKKENEKLKQDGLCWAKTAEARRKEIDKLRKDNTILKQQRDYLFDVIDEVLPHSGSTTAYNRMKNIGDVE